MNKGKKHEREYVEHEREVTEEVDEAGGDLGLRSPLRRLSRTARTHPVTTLALAAGVGALMGAELLAAGLAGGAAILFLQRSDLRERARHAVDNARERIGQGLQQMEHH
jgi:hypothetical protein